MGNPHAVVCVPDVAAAPVARLGAALQSHPFFPASVNVGFAEPSREIAFGCGCSNAGSGRRGRAGRGRARRWWRVG